MLFRSQFESAAEAFDALAAATDAFRGLSYARLGAAGQVITAQAGATA